MPTPPDMPPQPQTTEMPAVKVPKSQLDAVLEEIRAARAEGQETHEAVGALAANVEVLTKHVDTLTSRVTLVERRQDDAEGRARNHSGGITRVSENDARQDAAIAHVLERVEELAAKTDAQTLILQRLERGATAIVKNPHVQLVAGILWTALLGYLASKGLVAH